jgi:predicted extracellular nuclease
MLFANGTEVTDQTIKNKVDIIIATQDGTLKISTYNNSKYFVLSDNRILGGGATNFGKESVKDPNTQKKIIMTAILYKKTC